MNRLLPLYKITGLSIAFVFVFLTHGYAQKPLQKIVSVNVVRQPLSAVLTSIEKQGRFYFSYGSNLIPADSLVTLNISNKTTKEALDALLQGHYQYKEIGDHIIIQKPPAEKYTYLQARLVDKETGEAVDFASVYSKTLLISALSDEQGIFRLKVREKILPLELTISKLGYSDTSVTVSSTLPDDFKIGVKARIYNLNEVVVTNGDADRNFLSRLLVSARLRTHSRNITRFFVSFPYQASLLPGIGTHGRMGSQVVNKASLNLVGGYTGGTNGVEVAGVFNIARKDVGYFQAAGFFNFVSGNMKGFQAAGVYNSVQDSVSGMQAAGMGNLAEKTLYGVQAAGLFNTALADVTGAQLAGAYNKARRNMNGFQAAGVLNSTKGTHRGVQVSGLINRAGYIKGMQIGIINIADSSSGVSLGLFNFIKKGQGNLSAFTNEVTPLNLAWKTGSKKFYTILTAGTMLSPEQKRYSLGIGFGTEFNIYKRLGLITELTQNNLFLGYWENNPMLIRLQPALRFRLNSHFSLFGGPAWSAYYQQESDVKDGYQALDLASYNARKLSKDWSMWTGWQGGISWNYQR